MNLHQVDFKKFKTSETNKFLLKWYAMKVKLAFCSCESDVRAVLKEKGVMDPT